LNESDILSAIYFEVYGEKYNFKDSEKNSRLQKVVYLLQELGLVTEGYSFSLFENTPYSQRLQENAYKTLSIKEESEIKFSEKAKCSIDRLKSYLSRVPDGFGEDKWLDILASFVYFNRNLYELKTTKDVLKKLKDCKFNLETIENDCTIIEIFNTIFK